MFCDFFFYFFFFSFNDSMDIILSTDHVSIHNHCITFPIHIQIKHDIYAIHMDRTVRHVRSVPNEVTRAYTTVKCGPIQVHIAVPCRYVDSVSLDGYFVRINEMGKLAFVPLIASTNTQTAMYTTDTNDPYSDDDDLVSF